VVIGCQTFALHIPGVTSLKAKRAVLRSLKDRIRGRFNAAVSETALQDVHDRAEISVVTVGGSRALVDAALDHIDAFVASEPRVVVGPVRRELI
jgi:uncharacterized protein YlxP (DUF503 family)